MSHWLEFLAPLFLLLTASIDDLRSRKIHNYLLMGVAPFVLLAVFLAKGFVGLKLGFFLALAVFIMGIPIYLLRFIGGGDLKAFSFISFLFSLAGFWIHSFLFYDLGQPFRTL